MVVRNNEKKKYQVISRISQVFSVKQILGQKLCNDGSSCSYGAVELFNNGLIADDTKCTYFCRVLQVAGGAIV